MDVIWQFLLDIYMAIIDVLFGLPGPENGEAPQQVDDGIRNDNLSNTSYSSFSNDDQESRSSAPAPGDRNVAPSHEPLAPSESSSSQSTEESGNSKSVDEGGESGLSQDNKDESVQSVLEGQENSNNIPSEPKPEGPRSSALQGNLNNVSIESKSDEAYPAVEQPSMKDVVGSAPLISEVSQPAGKMQENTNSVSSEMSSSQSTEEFKNPHELNSEEGGNSNSVNEKGESESFGDNKAESVQPVLEAQENSNIIPPESKSEGSSSSASQGNSNYVSTESRSEEIELDSNAAECLGYSIGSSSEDWSGAVKPVGEPTSEAVPPNSVGSSCSALQSQAGELGSSQGKKLSHVQKFALAHPEVPRATAEELARFREVRIEFMREYLESVNSQYPHDKSLTEDQLDESIIKQFLYEDAVLEKKNEEERQAALQAAAKARFNANLNPFAQHAHGINLQKAIAPGSGLGLGVPEAPKILTELPTDSGGSSSSTAQEAAQAAFERLIRTRSGMTFELDASSTAWQNEPSTFNYGDVLGDTAKYSKKAASELEGINGETYRSFVSVFNIIADMYLSDANAKSVHFDRDDVENMIYDFAKQVGKAKNDDISAHIIRDILLKEARKRGGGPDSGLDVD